MSLTRGNIIDRCAAFTGDSSTEFRTYAETTLDSQLFVLWDLHDWEFKHKLGTFPTIASTETYNLSSGISDIRSAQDLELLYDSTNGRFLTKVELREIKKAFPKADQTNQPTCYAPWGTRTIYIHPIPDDAYTLKALYLSKPTLATDDADDLESVCGLPDYMHHLAERLVLKEMLLYIDDTRYSNLVTELEQIWLPNAIKADMKHLESGARFKFWEEELQNNSNLTFEDFLRQAWWGQSSDY